MMDDDPIVAEVRRVREQLFAQFNYDLSALVKHVQEKTEEAHRAGRKVVSLSPNRILLPPASANKVG